MIKLYETMQILMNGIIDDVENIGQKHVFIFIVYWHYNSNS